MKKKVKKAYAIYLDNHILYDEYGYEYLIFSSKHDAQNHINEFAGSIIFERYSVKPITITEGHGRKRK